MTSLRTSTAVVALPLFPSRRGMLATPAPVLAVALGFLGVPNAGMAQDTLNITGGLAPGSSPISFTDIEILNFTDAGFGLTVLSGGPANTLTDGGVANAEINILGVASVEGLVFDSGTVTSLDAGLTVLTNNSAATFTNEGVFSGTGALTIEGTGAVFLNGANTYSGDTTINGGPVSINNGSALGTGSVTVNNGGSLTLANGLSIGNEALSIAGSGAGSGALITDGSSVAFGGPITLTADATINASGGTLTLGGTIDKTDVTLTADTTGGTINFDGAITGNSDGAFDDDMTFDGGGVANLNAANSYQGKTNILNGTTVNANVANALPTANGRSEVTITGSTLNLGADQSIASLDGTGSVGLGANTLTMGYGTGLNTGGNAAADFAGVIGGTGGLTKDDTNTQTLSGANTYTGATNVNGGTLVLSGGGSLASTALDISGGAIFDDQNGGLDAGTAVANAGTLNINNVGETVLTYESNGGTLGGNSPLTTTGGATLNNNSTVTTVLIGDTQTSGTVGISAGGAVTGGTLTVNNGTLSVTGGAAILSGTSVNDGTLSLDGGLFSGSALTVGDSIGVPSSAVVESLAAGQLGLNTAAVTVNSDGELIAFNDSIASLDVVGGVVDTGAGAGLTVAGAVNLQGATIEGSGPFFATPGLVTVNASADSTMISSLVQLGPATTFDVANGAAAQDLVISGMVSGGSLDFIGAGTLVLSNGANTQTGTTINGGTLRIEADGAAGTGNITVLGSTIDYADGVNVANPVDLHADVDLNVDAGASATQTGPIFETGGPFGISKKGDGTLELAGANSYTGATNVDAGTLVLSGTLSALTDVTNAATLQVNTNNTVNTYVSNGGTLSGGSTLTATGGATLNGGSTVTGKLSGNTTTDGTVSISGAVDGGTLDVNGGLTTISGQFSYPTININNGELSLTGMASTFTGTTVNVGAGTTFDNTATQGINFGAFGVGDLVGSGGTISGAGLSVFDSVTLTGDTLSGNVSAPLVNLNDGTTISGSLLGDTVTTNDNVSVTGLLGDGTLTRGFATSTVANGTTTVATGTLTVSGAGELTSLTVNISDGATLDDQNAGIADGTAVFNNGGTLIVTGTDMVATYTSGGGVGTALLDGTGTLMATSYDLNDKSTIAGNLGNGPVTTEGSVMIAATGTTGTGPFTVLNGLTTNAGMIGGNVVVNGGTFDNDNMVAGKLENNAFANNNSMLTGDFINYATGTGTNSGTVFDNLDNRGIFTNTGTVVGTTGNTGDLSNTGAGLLTGDVTNNAGSITTDADGIGDMATLQNNALVTLTGNDTISSYISDGGTLAGLGILTATNGATLNDGSFVTGNLSGNTSTDGAVSISGSAMGDTLDVNGGLTDISGTFGYSTINVNMGQLSLTGPAAPSTPTDVNLAAGTTFHNSATDGIFFGGGSDLIGNGATISGPGLSHFVTVALNGDTVSGDLAASTAILNDGTTVSGNLLSLAVTTNGAVGVTGTLGDGTITRGIYGFFSPSGVTTVATGTLTMSGAGQLTSQTVNISDGATVIDMSANALGDTADVTNGGLLVLNGAETVGSYHNLGTGTLQVNIDSPVLRDRLIAGTVTLDPGSTLRLEDTDLALGEIADIIDGTITGSFAIIDPVGGTGMNLRYSFNPNTGEVQAIAPVAIPTKPANRLFNLTENQTAAIGTSFEDSYIDPAGGGGNFRRIYYREVVPGDPDPAVRWMQIPEAAAMLGDTFVLDLDPGLGLMPTLPGTQSRLLSDAIIAFQSTYMPGVDGDGNPIVLAGPVGLAIANSLSPEVHQGMGDFTEQAMRRQVRLATRTAPIAKVGKGNVFAAVHTSSAGSSSSRNNADYDIKVDGVVAGARYEVMPGLQIGAMLGADNGSIEGALIDTDGSGFVVGIFGEYVINPDTGLKVFSSLSYGDYEYDAARRSFGGLAVANGIGSDALEFVVGVEGTAWEHENFSLRPMAALRYMTGEVDGFTERGPGVQLMVNGYDIDSLLLEIGLNAEIEVNEVVTVTGHLGFVTDFAGSGNSISSTYVGGGTPFTVSAPGVDDDALVLGLGAYFDVTETVQLGVNWRTEFRNSSQSVNTFGVGAAFGF